MLNQQSSVAPPSDRIKSFGGRWVSFWAKLVHTAEATGALYDETLLESVVLPWIVAISAAKLRVWRRMGSLAAFSMIDSLTEISARLQDRLATLDTQIADPKLTRGVRQEAHRTRETARDNKQAQRLTRAIG